VDAEKPGNADKPSAKIIPFGANQTPSHPPPDDANATEAWLVGVITEAVDTSDWSRTRQEDLEALEDERAFHRRFGFTVNRARRKKVLNFKHVADVTDREIRLLWQTVNLNLNDDQARITTSNLAARWGYVLMTVVALLMLMGFVAGVKAEVKGLPQLATLAAVELVLASLLMGIERLYVRPNQIRRRILREGKGPV
jgi:uncharacterized membrane protein YciS (DUF1049 family)